jgi:hypothetical protein
MSAATEINCNRAAAFALGSAALLFAVFPLIRPFFRLDPRSPDALAIAAISSLPWLLSHLLLLAAFLLLMLGLLGLYAALARDGEDGRALRALVLSLLGIALVLPMVGVEVFAMPQIGRAFLADRPEIGAAFNQIYRGPGTLALLAGLLSLAIGGFYFAAALRQVPGSARWAGLALALGLALWCPLLPMAVRIADGFLIGIGGLWVAWIMGRRA